jgi:hypothetical protein
MVTFFLHLSSIAELFFSVDWLLFGSETIHMASRKPATRQKGWVSKKPNLCALRCIDTEFDKRQRDENPCLHHFDIRFA